MRSLLLTVLVLAMLPDFADAQRRTRGEPDANWGEMDRFSKSASPLTVRDVENLSALKTLMDERKKLKLADDQLTQLKSLMAAEQTDNRAGLSAVDSLRKIARGRPTAMSPEEETRMLVARAELRGVIDTILVRYRASVAQLMPVLTDAQRAEAAPLLEKHAAETRATLRAKFAEMNQRPAGPRGGAEARRRP